MDIDINTLRGISTLLLMIAFVGLCLWAYSSKRKALFDEAAHIPFADDASERKSKSTTEQRIIEQAITEQRGMK